MCAFGAVLGVLLAFIHSPFFSVTQPWQLSVFVEWLLLPQSYWPWPLLGFLMSGLIFYAVQLFKQVQAITGAGDPLAAAGRDRIARLSQVLAVPIEKPLAFAASGRTFAVEATDQAAKVAR